MRRIFFHLSIILGTAVMLLPFGERTVESKAVVPEGTAKFAQPGTPCVSSSFDGDDSDSDMPVRDQETVRKTFELSAAGEKRMLDVDNVTGFIEVVGTDSNQVQLVVNRTTRAESQEKLDLARKEVALDITQQPDSVKLYVNGPFRCPFDGGRSVSFRGRLSYWVQMDFQLQVPRQIQLTLSTVNSGHIRVSDVKGPFEVHNVNGEIEMLGMAGSGTAHTVNGRVHVTFAENPRELSSFKSVNGNIELFFQRNLSADFRFRTFNGGIYSDFPVTALPARPLEERREGGKVIFRADRYTNARIGSGGTEIRTENLNGDIRIRENHE